MKNRFPVVIELTEKEINIIIMAMSASQVPMDIQKDTFELVERIRAIKAFAYREAIPDEAT